MAYIRCTPWSEDGNSVHGCNTQLLEDKGSSSILFYFSFLLPLILFQFPHPRSGEGLGCSCQCGLSMRLEDHRHVLSHCLHQALYGENIWTGYIQDHHCVYHVIYDRYLVVRTFEPGTCKIMTVSITMFVTGIMWWELLNWVHASTRWQPSWSFYSKCRNVLFPMLSLCNSLGLVVCSGHLHWHVDDELVFSHLWFPKWWQHIGYGHKFLVDFCVDPHYFSEHIFSVTGWQLFIMVLC